MRKRLGTAAGLGLLCLAAGGAATAATPCDAAALAAARETGVSLALLRAIMLAESGTDRGQGREAWPWTVQSQGRGYWLETPEEAITLVQDLIDQGETNIDLGCFQINLRWHGEAFPSLEAMIEPMANARYAAGYLLELYDQTGDWKVAAGSYHSRDATRAEGYVARLVALHNEDVPPPQPAPGPAQAPSPEGGPLIVLGSLAAPLIAGLP